jgi:signal transduction histidine kinase
MRVRTHFALFGAALPAAALLAAILVAGWLFRADQLDELDRRLLAQAAVESVGLFDGRDGGPHVHVPSSPIADEVADFAPTTVVYDARGAPATARPDGAPTNVPLVGPLERLRLRTTTLAGVERRELELPLRSPDGATYTLWLGASLAPIDVAMTRFYRATLLALASVASLLLAVQLTVARRLATRVEEMTRFLPKLLEGATNLPRDPVRDEFGELRDTIRDVAVLHAGARVEQDRLLASAAHELRTPLTVIRTEIDLALRRERSPAELRDALRSARSEVVRLAELAGALLDLQAIRHVGFERRDGDLVGLVREAVGALAGVADTSGVELRVRADGPARARFDERTMRQAIDNVLGNALKHARSAAVVDIAVERRGDRWQIAVSDAGPGIPAVEAERVFEPFHRLRPASTPGAGLGLAIVREVAQRHGGRAFVDLAYTDGARVVIEIPA